MAGNAELGTDDPTTVTIELCEEHFSQNKSKKSKASDEKIEITSAVCAFFNSKCGGILNISLDDKCFEDKATQPKTIDNISRRIEQSVANFAGLATVSEAFILQDTNDNGFWYDVKPAKRFCTVEYNLHLATNRQVNAISFGDWEKVGALLRQQQQITEVAFKDYSKEFRYMEKAPDCLREGREVQFKHLKNEATKGTSLADRITNKTNKLVQYVSAFANQEGGTLYFGIDDTTYVVKGQVANVSQRKKIEARVSTELSKMIWPVQNSDHVHFWKIDFVPVVQKVLGTSRYEVCHDLFVIVLSVAKCPGGVFSREPESYHFVNGKAERIPFPLWKEKILADCANSYDGDHISHTKRQSKALAPVVYKSISATGWSSDKLEKEYMEVAQLMENLRNNGNWFEIDRIAKKVLTPRNTNADLKLAVTFQCTAAAYRQNKHPEAYDFLKSYQSLLKQAENRAIFQVQELYSWSAIKRSERNYQESYKYTYDALQKMQLIVPGWITAWFLCNAASLLTILASEEPDPIRKQELIDEAEHYYVQALEHAQTITDYKKAAANIKHRVHINLAMLYLDSSPKFNAINFNQTVSSQNLKRAKESLQAAEDFEGAPMTGFNEFHFLLAKSDLCLRYFYQNPDENSEYVQKALEFANHAQKVAKEHDFEEVLHYAESRLAFLQTIPKEDQKTADLVDIFLKTISFS